METIEQKAEYRCEVCRCCITFRGVQPIGMNAVRCSRCRDANHDPKRPYQTTAVLPLCDRFTGKPVADPCKYNPAFLPVGTLLDLDSVGEFWGRHEIVGFFAIICVGYSEPVEIRLLTALERDLPQPMVVALHAARARSAAADAASHYGRQLAKRRALPNREALPVA